MDVCALVCSPGGLINSSCIEMDCDTLLCDISVSSLRRVSRVSVLTILSLFFNLKKGCNTIASGV